jgi:tetratricopeptide (TPR) repeat protein
LVDAEAAYLHRAKVLANHPGWVDAIEARWPGPVAYTYRLVRQLLRNGQVDAAALVLKDLAEVLARLSALILAQDSIHNRPPEGVLPICCEFFGAPPSMGVWMRLADTWSRQVQKAPQGLLFPEIANLWRTCNDKRTSLNILLSDHIVNWRNETIGHGVRGADLNPIMVGLERFLGEGPKSIHAALSYFADLWEDVVLCNADGRLLMGADSILSEVPNGHAFEQVLSVYLLRLGRKLDLRPWISARRCQVCGQFETYLYDSMQARRTIPNFRLVNYDTGHRYSLRGAADPQMLQYYSTVGRSMVDTVDGFDQDSLPEEVAQLLEEQAAEHDYLSPTYLRNPLRSFIEDTLGATRGGVFWLQAPAHVGKSTFVQGLDPDYQAHFREDPQINGLAVVVFYIRREYQYHLAQFADQLRERIKAALDIRAHNKPLPSLDIEHPGPQVLCDFLEAFQRLGRRALLVIIDGLDELAEEHPSIVDYLPRTSMMPPQVMLLVTSRLPEELPVWLREKTDALQDALLHRIDLGNTGYVALMENYASHRLGRVLARDDALLQFLRNKSGGRFLYFAFLVQRIKDGGLTAAELGNLADSEHLVPQYLDALRQRYAATTAGDLIQRVLIWMAAAEEAYVWHNEHLPRVAQRPWMGLPMDVLCQAMEGQPSMTPRLTHVLYLLKPLLATWRGDAGYTRYRLGIKGLCEMVRQHHAAELDQMHDHLVRHLFMQQAALDSTVQRNADMDWVACHLDGFGALVSLPFREESRHDPTSQQVLKSLMEEFFDKGDIERASEHYYNALSSYRVVQGIIDWLVGDSPGWEEQDNWLRNQWLNLLNKYAVALNSAGENEGALVVYDRAIALWEALHMQMGAQFSLDMTDNLGLIYMNRGTALSNIGETRGALASYDKANALWEAQLKQMTPASTNNLAMSYVNRGNTLRTTGETTEALYAFAKACGLWEALRKLLGVHFPPDMANSLASAYTARGVTLGAAGHPQKALVAFDKAWGLWKPLRKLLGERFPPYMANCLADSFMNRGNALSIIGETRRALAAYAKASALWEALHKQLGGQCPPSMAHRLALNYMNRGNTLLSTKNNQEALAAYADASALWEALRNQLGAQFRPDMVDGLAGSYMHRGNALHATEDNQGALVAYAEASALWEALHEKLGTQFPPNMVDCLALNYMNWGVVLSFDGDNQGALSNYAKAFVYWNTLREQLGEQFPSYMTDCLALTCMKHGLALVATGDSQGALLSYSNAIGLWEALREQLAGQFPQDMADNLALSYKYRGIALHDFSRQ